MSKPKNQIKKVKNKAKRLKAIAPQLAKWVVLLIPVLLWFQFEAKQVLITKEGESVSAARRNPNHIQKNPKDHDKRVNALLKEIDDKRAWESAKVEVENYHYAPEVDGFKGKGLPFEETLLHGVMEQNDEMEREVQQGEAKSYQATRILDERINQKLWKAQVDEREDERATEDYAKAFVENARRAGYAVTLDKDFRVLNVRKIQQSRPIF